MWHWEQKISKGTGNKWIKTKVKKERGKRIARQIAVGLSTDSSPKHTDLMSTSVYYGHSVY